MTNSPACHFSPSVTRPTSPAFGGNLGQPLAKSRLAHFSSLEQAHDLAAHISNANEAAVLPPAASTGAAINRRHATAAPSTAESRPFPFPKVNHVAHFQTSVADTTEVNGSAFA